MVIDLKRIVLGNYLEDDALWIVEQIPGLVVGTDQTALLRTGNLLNCLSVWLAQLVKALAALIHVRLCVQEVRVRTPEQTSSTLASIPPG